MSNPSFAVSTIKQMAAILCRRSLCRTVSAKLGVPENISYMPLITQTCQISSAVRRHTSNHLSNRFNTEISLLSLPNIEDRVIKRSYVSKKDYPFVELKEEELEEDFVRGSGPGGQSVNQTANCVVLKHVPTGITVKCHDTRSQHQNRQLARERLREKLDLHLNGSSSFLALQQEEASLRRKEKKKKNKSRLELKKAFKEREGID